MGRLRRLVLGAGVLIAGAFGATFGWVLVTGALPGPLAGLAGGVPAGIAALGLFLMAVTGIVGLALVLGALALRPYGARSSSATP